MLGEGCGKGEQRRILHGGGEELDAGSEWSADVFSGEDDGGRAGEAGRRGVAQ